ncbi:MAG: CHASE domain-containing protein [Planctomycetes bacterium]|nr:CHASE domain-containing protein [Planctomycetota bacterium]
MPLPSTSIPTAVAALILAVGIAGSLATARSMQQTEITDSEARFATLSRRLTEEVQRRLSLVQYGLNGIRAAYAASNDITRTEFADLAATRDLPREFPGVRGLGFIRRIARTDLEAFIAEERADAGAGFDVKTAGEAPDLYVITRIEPLANNRPAWGFDIGQEPRRREAAEIAVATGEARLTRAVILVQDGRKGPGYLLLLPIYRHGMAPQTPDERRADLIGLAYSPIVVAEVLKQATDVVDRQLDCELFDGMATTAAERVFDADGHLDALVGAADSTHYRGRTHSAAHLFSIGGRMLTLTTSTTPAFDATMDRSTPQVVAISGMLISALSALAIWLLGRGRADALRLAAAMTSDLAAAKTAAEEALRESQTLHEALQRHAIVSITDRTGSFIAVNDAFCRISGYAREELVGRNHRVVNSGTHPPEFWREMWQTVSGGATWRQDVCNRAKDGSLYWVDSIIAPFHDSAGRVERFISISQDITARRRAQEATQQLLIDLERQTALANDMAARAEMANAAKSSFLANMSHEIRTPMNGVLGMTELLMAMDLNTEQKDAASTIYRSAESLLTILNDILDFSKIEAGRLDLERIPFDMQQMLFDVVELFRPRLSGGEVELLVHIDPAAPRRVIGDPGRVRQILTNLVGNAVKFTAQGHVLIELLDAPDGITLRVVDTGVGIPPDRQAALFQPFTQADASTARKYGGTGLGLAICQRLANAMEGGIELASRPGQGTTFSVRLPLPDDPHPPPAVSPPAVLAGRRVLVVDDNAVHRGIVAEQLSGLGCLAEMAPDSTTALLRLQGDPACDAVIIDKHMPHMDGPTLAARLRGDSRNAGLALVSCTSSGLRGDAQEMERAGFNGYITKPAPTAILGGVLATAIERARTGQGGLVTRHQVIEATPAKSAPSPGTVRHGLRVLLAEDNPVNQRIATIMLQKLGCAVTLAGDGRQAVEAWKAGTFDVVFMDCQMPEMDGFEATIAIRNAERARDRRTPIIAMTANASDEDRQQCLAVGMDAHVGKPVRSLDIATALLRLTGSEG